MMVARGRNPDSTRAGTGFRGPKPRESGPGQGGSRGPKPRQFRQFGGQNPVSWPREGQSHAPGPMSAADPPAGHRAGETSLLPHFFCRGPKPRVRQHRPIRGIGPRAPRRGQTDPPRPGLRESGRNPRLLQGAARRGSHTSAIRGRTHPQRGVSNAAKTPGAETPIPLGAETPMIICRNHVLGA
jgi:hypothetical protein